MLKDSWHARLFIRSSIWMFRSIAPLSISYCCLRILRPSSITWSSPWLYLIDAYAGLETLFYLMLYLPRKYYLNRPANPYTPLSSPQQREEAFSKVWESTYDARAYISNWFYGAPVESLGREDMKDFISWSLWNESTRYPEHEKELEKYLLQTEEVLGMKFPETETRTKSMMVTFEPLNLKHKPLLWYGFIIPLVDFQCWVTMQWLGFTHFRVSLSRQLLGTIPIRPWILLSRNHSPSSRISYWYHPHTSKTQRPIVFVHGIGVGLQFYLPFFKQLLAKNPEVGILAIELLHVSNRITRSPPTPTESSADILSIVHEHNFQSAILLTHSYGSAIAAHMLRHPQSSSLSHLIFVDPVTFTFHDPTIAFNFLRRSPRTASEIQLEYYASTDTDVARTLTRAFNWSENTLWREEVETRRANGKKLKTTVMIGAKDIITDTLMLGRYLTRRVEPGVKWYQSVRNGEKDDAWQHREWSGKDALEVVWCPELNHAEVFDTPRYLDMLINVICVYCEGAPDVVAGH